MAIPGAGRAPIPPRIRDTEDMDREGAETYLRLLAEAELRRATTIARGSLPGQWRSTRLEVVAPALRAVGAVGTDVTDEIEADLGLALAGRYRLSLYHIGRPRSRPVPRRVAGRIVPVGQVIKVRHDDLRDEILVVAYAGVAGVAGLAGGARFIVVGRPFPPFAAVDDQGVSYQITWTGGHTASELLLRPAPAHQIRWLDFTGAVEAPARINLGPRNPGPDVSVTPAVQSPGELLLEVIAARILSLVGYRPRDDPAPPTASADLHAFIGDAPGHIVAALREAGVLAHDSPAPGQLAGLCARIGLDGHGITAPPAGDLPERWESMLTPPLRRGWRPPPAPAILAVTAAELPERDGATITILGVTQSLLLDEPRTIMHLLASGVTVEDDWKFARGIIPLPALWIRDSNGRWHTTRADGVSPWGDTGMVALGLEIVPPVEHGTAWIEVSAAGSTAQAQVTLPLNAQ